MKHLPKRKLNFAFDLASKALASDGRRAICKRAGNQDSEFKLRRAVTVRYAGMFYVVTVCIRTTVEAYHAPSLIPGDED